MTIDAPLLAGRITGPCGRLRPEIVDSQYLYICGAQCQWHRISVAAADGLAARHRPVAEIRMVRLLGPGRVRITYLDGHFAELSMRVIDASVDFEALP